MTQDERLNELEIKISFTENLLDELNHTIFRQQQQIDYLVGEIRLMREQQEHAEPGTPRSLFDEIPPHY